jgi:cyclophilin family peptidyl-prolyl cis-trans isomerase
VGKSQAQRDKEQRRTERLAAQRAAEVRIVRRRRLFTVILVVLLVASFAGMVLGGILVDDDDEQADPTLPTFPSTTVTPTTFGPPVSVTLPPAGETISGATPCPETDGSSPRTTTFSEPPPMCIDTDMRYQAVIHTSEGDLRYLLHEDASPQTVNNFIVLSRYHYYDGLPFYRIVPRMMLLTGDATGDPEIGAGGPGYTIDDEIPEVGVLYLSGSLHAWTDEADANGSRLLISTGDEDTLSLPSKTLIGTMLEGTEIMRAMERKGTPTGEPSDEVVITSIEIIEEPDPEGPDPEDADGTTTTGGG